MKAADRTRRLLVMMVLCAGVLFVSAMPAFAFHEGDGDGRHACVLVDSNMAHVEDDPVDTDTGNYYVCAGPGPDYVFRDGGPTSHGGGVGDVGAGDASADADDIVPAARIDAGGGGAATGVGSGLLAGLGTAGSLALVAIAARLRR